MTTTQRKTYTQQVAEYQQKCAQATTDQGLDPIVAALTAEVLPVTVEQTGGWVMAVHVPRPDGAFLVITNDGYVVEDDKVTDGYFITRYENDDDHADGGGTILTEDTPSTDHVVDYVRGFLTQHRPPSATRGHGPNCTCSFCR